MKKIEQIIEWYPDEEFLQADGFDDAIIGVMYDKIKSLFILVYSRTKCIETLVKRDGMSYEEAAEYFDFNVDGAYMGEKTSIFVNDEMFNME